MPMAISIGARNTAISLAVARPLAISLQDAGNILSRRWQYPFKTLVISFQDAGNILSRPLAISFQDAGNILSRSWQYPFKTLAISFQDAGKPIGGKLGCSLVDGHLPLLVGVWTFAPVSWSMDICPC
jgi:hypothetical protein